MARQHDDRSDDHLLGDAVDIHLFARREAEAAIDNVFAPHDALPGAVLPVRGEHASAREAYASAAEKAYITTCDGETRKTARTQLVIATTERFAPNDPTVLASWIANHLALLDERYGEGVVLAAAVERRPDAAIIRAILLPSDVGLHAKRQFDPDYRVKISKQRTKQQVTVIGTVTPGEPAQVKPTRRKSIRVRLSIAKQPKPAAIATDILVPHVIAASEKASDASLPVTSVLIDGSPANTTSLGTSGAQSGGLGSVPRSDYATCCNDRRNDADQPSRRTEALYRLRIVRHRPEAYAAMAAGGSCAARISAGGRNPCRSISHVSL
ncbi:hypothetical protein SAMN02799636_05944 [Methylobacterium sp. 275MFSha3.1]|uniref:hypothetical protein n=1 Tax=Methylobacterium sp. 275MFSha3.1 TaxID=1502746 RepID=UPI0008A74462|nr:hypothetical protein [Methylobacterium sp. 275MFSha3.1]SEI14465.1 hypothetical protein SAMN02799636_05944 [Methylobacterium sp. 275MFSha3.1]